MGRTIAEVSEQTLKIEAFLRDQKKGTRLSYDYIQHRTGVIMDKRGKQYLRTALRRAGLESATEKGYGIVLADEENAMAIVANRLKKIDRTVHRGEKTHKTIQQQFFDSLPQDKQKEILYIGAVFGAIRVAAENGRVVYSNKPKQVKSSINIPVFGINNKS